MLTQATRADARWRSGSLSSGSEESDSDGGERVRMKSAVVQVGETRRQSLLFLPHAIEFVCAMRYACTCMSFGKYM